MNDKCVNYNSCEIAQKYVGGLGERDKHEYGHFLSICQNENGETLCELNPSNLEIKTEVEIK